MEVIVNDNLKSIPLGSALSKAIDGLVSQESKGIAIAVNNTVVQKVKWNDFILHEGDKVTVIKATQGG